jgi:hypothetical protein
MHILLVEDEMKMARAQRRDVEQEVTRPTRSPRARTTGRVVDVAVEIVRDP